MGMDKDAWLESLAENYQLPEDRDSKKSILKETQLKQILGNEVKKSKVRKDSRRTSVRNKG